MPMRRNLVHHCKTLVVCASDEIKKAIVARGARAVANGDTELRGAEATVCLQGTWRVVVCDFEYAPCV